MIEGRPFPPITTAAATQPVASPTPAAATKEGTPFGEVLRALGNETKRGERLVERATHAGGDLSPGDLLALQAGVYRWVEVVDLSSKLVDRATQAAKTVTQGNG